MMDLESVENRGDWENRPIKYVYDDTPTKRSSAEEWAEYIEDETIIKLDDGGIDFDGEKAFFLVKKIPVKHAKHEALKSILLLTFQSRATFELQYIKTNEQLKEYIDPVVIDNMCELEGKIQ
jgi:hypothetical protein